MKQRGGPGLQARIAKRPTAIPARGPVEWTVRIANPGTATMHVATAIQQLHPAADGRTLVVSTERPIFDDSVSLAFFSLETRPIQPGETIDQDFKLEFPLRLVTMSGFPPKAETTLWSPAAEFRLVTHLAYGDRPFQRPAQSRRLAASLREWSHVIEAPAMRLRPIRQREE